MEITLSTPQKIILVQEQSTMANKVIINHFIDNGKKVEADITFTGPDGEQNQIWTLWDGQEYINIGQYTDTDIQNRLNELLNL